MKSTLLCLPWQQAGCGPRHLTSGCGKGHRGNVFLALVGAAATHGCSVWQLETTPCLHACRLIALPSGYHLATVDAVRELLTVQAQTVGTRMRPAQYGA